MSSKGGATTLPLGLYGQAGPNFYASMSPLISSNSIAMATLNDSRFVRVTMAQTGVLHDVSAFVNTQSGNYKIGIYDTGNLNATHTTSTQLAVSNSAVVPASGWMTYDPSLAVLAGDTLNFHLSIDNTTAAVVGFNGFSGAAMQLPSSSFYTPSGAGTMTPKLAGLTSSFFTTPPTTITDANHTTQAKAIMFVWRIT